MIFECRACKQPFAGRPAAIRSYCSRECYLTARWGDSRSKTLKCKTCGKPFKVIPARDKDPRAGKYCSRKCQYIDKRSNLTTDCQHCGTTFTYVKGRPRKFCTRACYEQHRAENNTVTKTCEVCGKEFRCPKATADRYNRCSDECGKGERRRPCKRCGTLVLVKPSDTRSDPHCSEECRRPPRTVTCIVCGKEHRVTPTVAEARRFCSIACYRRHRGETTLEETVRESLERLGIPFEQERKMGRYSVDFFLPHTRTVLEVDGSYWHQNPERDAKRDRRLSQTHDVTVKRLGEREVLDATDIDALVASRVQVIDRRADDGSL